MASNDSLLSENWYCVVRVNQKSTHKKSLPRFWENVQKFLGEFIKNSKYNQLGGYLGFFSITEYSENSISAINQQFQKSSTDGWHYGKIITGSDEKIPNKETMLESIVESLDQNVQYQNLDGFENFRFITEAVFKVRSDSGLDFKEVFAHCSKGIEEKINLKTTRKENEKTLRVLVLLREEVSLVSTLYVRRKKKRIILEKKVFLIKFDELYLKGSNRSSMINYFIKNIQSKLKNNNLECTVHKEDTILSVLPTNQDNFEEVADVLKCIPGITNFSLCWQVTLDIDKAVKATLDFINTVPHDNTASIELDVRLCNTLKWKSKTDFIEPVKAKLKETLPDREFTQYIQKDGARLSFVFTIHSNCVFVHYSKIKGIGGLPTTTEQTCISLLSGGFDSPVAAYTMMKRGCTVVLVHFQNQNQMESAVQDKIVRIAKNLSKYQVKTHLYIIPFADIQQDIIEKVGGADRMLIYRRFMMIIAGKICKKYNGSFLVTGDSMAQVASQTVRNLEAIYKTSEVPILSPLIGMNKSEILALSEKIGTFDLSKLPYGDCCSYFLDKHPRLHYRAAPNISKFMVKFDIFKLSKDAIQRAEVLTIFSPDNVLVSREMKKSEIEAPQICLFESANEENEKIEIENADENIDDIKNELDLPNLDQMDEDSSSSEDYVDSKKRERQKEFNSELEAKKRKIECFEYSQILPEKKEIYLDNAATTKVEDEVVKAMIPHFITTYGNPHASHRFGKVSNNYLEEARIFVASTLKAKSNEIIFTSGGTESNNIAIFGIAQMADEKKNVILTTQIEHSAVLEPLKEVSKKYGAKIINIPIDQDGKIIFSEFQKLVNENTLLVTIGHANNEIGTIQNVAEIGKLCREKGVFFHIDACQSYTKVDIDVETDYLDLVTINSHKIHGPPGVGALFIRETIKLHSITFGGSQEFEHRPGTVNIPGVVGFTTAAKLQFQNKTTHIEHMEKIQKYTIDLLLEKFPGTFLNGPKSGENRLCNNISVSFKKIEADMLLAYLSKNSIYCSSGAACSSSELEISHVMKAIFKELRGKSTIRISISKFTTIEEIDTLTQHLELFGVKTK